MSSASSYRKSPASRSLAAIGIAVSLVLSRGALVNGAEEGWSLSKLNPFGSARSSATKPKTPSSSRKASSSKSKPAPNSTLSSVTKSTSNFMGKTKETLMPWSKPSKPTKPPASVTGSKKSSKRPVQQAAWYEFWKGEPEQKQGPKTVNEFLALPRPE